MLNQQLVHAIHEFLNACLSELTGNQLNPALCSGHDSIHRRSGCVTCERLVVHTLRVLAYACTRLTDAVNVFQHLEGIRFQRWRRQRHYCVWRLNPNYTARARCEEVVQIRLTFKDSVTTVVLIVGVIKEVTHERAFDTL